MISINDFMAMLLYIALIILVVMLTTLAYKCIKTLKKVDQMIDDVEEKSSKLDGMFNIIDTTTDVIVGMSDTIVSTVTHGIEGLIKRKKGKDKDE